MRFSNAISDFRVPFRKNLYLITLFTIFMVYWASTLITTPDLANWALENALVFIFLGYLIFSIKKHQFSDLSYTLIFVYLLLHVYGAKYTYAENPFGYWLQDTFDLGRNHYHRS